MVRLRTEHLTIPLIMAEETVRYFTHDCNARNSIKVTKLRMKYGAAGYGIFFMLLERLREAENYMSVRDYNAIGFDLHVDANQVKAIVEDFGLFVFTDDGKYFYSKEFTRRMTIKDELSQKRAEIGRLGGTASQARVKQNSSKGQAKVEQSLSKGQAKVEQRSTFAQPIKIKENKRKEKEEYSSFHSESSLSAQAADEPTVEPETHEKKEVCFEDFMRMYNDTLSQAQATIASLKTSSQLTEKRKGMIRARVKEYGWQNVCEMVHRAAQSHFLNGQNDRGWVATLNWLFLPNNFAKVIEGAYDNREAVPQVLTKPTKPYAVQQIQTNGNGYGGDANAERAQRMQRFAAYAAEQIANAHPTTDELPPELQEFD